MDKTIFKRVILVNLILCGAAVAMSQEESEIPVMNSLEACALAPPEPFNHNIKIAEGFGAGEAEIRDVIEFVYDRAVEEGVCK